jgi:hypothetical protein
MFGILPSPVIAAAAMALSSVSVVPRQLRGTAGWTPLGDWTPQGSGCYR